MTPFGQVLPLRRQADGVTWQRQSNRTPRKRGFNFPPNLSVLSDDFHWYIGALVNYQLKVSSMPSKAPPHNPTHRPAVLAFYLTLSALLVASFFPEYRLWGAGGWSYLSLTTRLIIFALAAAVPLLLVRLGSHSEGEQALSARVSLVLSLVVIVALAVLYLLLNARTHFLGDGYTVLANLACENPTWKPREIGAEMVNHLVRQAFGGGGDATALRAYQTISIGAGLLFLMVVLWSSARLFVNLLDRLLFQISLSLCGCTLLFFGYVENYALFCISVTAFTLTGLLAARESISRWWVLLPLAMALFFHVLGVALIPAALYLTMRNSGFAHRLGSLNSGNRLLLSSGILVVAGIAFAIIYQRDYFVRFAVVPLLPNRFSIPGYTLLAPRHLADMANLVFLLVPGIGVLLSVIVTGHWKSQMKLPHIRFTLILTITTLLAAFVLDPKLGMARDWDLFSLPAIPLTALLLMALFGLQTKRRPAAVPLLLSAVLSAAVLLPRAVVLHTPSMGVAQAQALMTMDSHRSRSGINVLAKYLHQTGDTARYNELQTLWRERYPEQQLVAQAVGLIDAGRHAEARSLLERARVYDPQYSEVWNGLGRCYVVAGQPDSGLEAIRIADGLNPYSPVVLSDLGEACIDLELWDEAEDAYGRSTRIDSTACVPLICLAFLQLRKGDAAQYEAYLNRGLTRTDATAANLQGLGRYFLRKRSTKLAVALYQNALARGLDSAVVREMAGRYPDLNSIL